MPSYSPDIRRTSDKNLLRWFFIIIFVWLIPSTIFWLSSYLFISEVCDRKDSNSLNEIENELENIAYGCNRERYFQEKFSYFYKDLKGSPCNSKSRLNDLINNFINSFPKGMLEVYLFNGKLEILNTDGAKKEHEQFLKLATLELNEESITEEKTEDIGKVIPEPLLILRRVRAQKGRALELGNPDRYSLCYFNSDLHNNSQLIGGILIFVHYNKLKNKIIISETLSKRIPKEDFKTYYGFVDSDNSQLPGNLENSPINRDFIYNYYKQNSTNRFRRFSKLVCVKRLTEHCLLIGSADINQPSWGIFLIIGLLFITASVYFFKLTYQALVSNPNQGLNLRQRIIWLFAICFIMPLIVGAILASQYLTELKSSLLFIEEQENYKRLSEIDSGFSMYTTSKLISFRKQNEQLSKYNEEPDKIVDYFKQLCNECFIDGAHLVSSDSKVLLSSALVSSEVRRHKDKTESEKQEVLTSWLDRNALLLPIHMAYLEGKNTFLFPTEDQKTEAHKAFTKVFSSTAASAMEYYNQSKNLKVMSKKTKSDLIVGALVESHSMGLFNAAKTNISRFTQLEAISEKLLCYLDVIPGPLGEAWYAYVTITNLDNLEREYLTNLFHDIKIRNKRINRVFPEEDIRAISVHPYATCFPSIMEYQTFKPTILQSENNSKTFTRQMTLNGEVCYVSVLRGSYLKHYLLLKIFKEKDILKIYKKQANTLLLIFIIILIMGLALIRILSKVIIMPITDIIKAVKSLSNKDYNSQVVIQSGNEFGILANAFNKTANTLQQLNLSSKNELFFPIETKIRCGSYLVNTAKITSGIVASDYYECLELKQGKFAIISANISGNDVKSLHLMAMLKTSFITLMPMYINNPETMMNKLNLLFAPYLKDNYIVNCFIGILDPTNDIITCSNTGQPFPILYDVKRNAQEFVNLPSTSLGLGSKSDNSYRRHEIQLRHKIFIIYSHGAEDLVNNSNNEYNKNQFAKVVADNIKPDAQNPAELIINSIKTNANLLPWHKDLFVITIQNRI